MRSVVLEHRYALDDYFLEEHGVKDLQEAFEKYEPTCRNFDIVFTCRLYGYESPEEYWYKASCFHRIPYIKVPTLFINTLDDPIVGYRGIDFDVFKSNKYCALATLNTGGHLGFYEQILSMD